MSISFSAAKQIAKQITLIRYIPQLQVYELNIVWEDKLRGESSTFFMPEMFIYPYAVERKLCPKENKTIKPKQSEQTSRLSQRIDYFFDTQLELPVKLSNAQTPKKSDTKITPKRLDYDSLSESISLKEELLRRNKTVLNLRVKEGRKKMKT